MKTRFLLLCRPTWLVDQLGKLLHALITRKQRATLLYKLADAEENLDGQLVEPFVGQAALAQGNAVELGRS